MSAPALDDLLVPKTKDQWTAIAIAQLQGKGFPTTDWTSTSPERAMIETDTACLADQSEQIPLIVQLALVTYALASDAATAPATEALQFLAHNWYQIDAFAATATVGNMTLACASTAGPYTIEIGQLTAVDDSGEFAYSNSTGGSLASGGTLALSWQCTTPGIGGNVSGGTISTLLTPLPGVTVSNDDTVFSSVAYTDWHGTGTVDPSGTPPDPHSVTVRIDTTGASGVATWSTSLDGGAWTTHGSAASIADLSGTDIDIALVDGATAPSFYIGDTATFTAPGTWITTQGTDLETQGSLAARCLARWPSLAAVPVADVYSVWAREALDGEITRVLVETDPSVAATVNIYIAGPSATATTVQVGEVQDYIDVRAPLTDLPVVIAAGATAVAITGAATYPIGQSSVVAERTNAINAYVNGISMGGKIEVAWINSLAMNLVNGIPTGATNITGTQLNGGGDLTLSAHNIATVTNSIVWTAA